MVRKRAEAEPRAVANAAAGVLFTLIVFWIDYATGPDVGMSFFYLLPIIYCGWYVSQSCAFAIAATATVAWFFVRHSLQDDVPRAVQLWNGGMRFAIFTLVAFLTSRVRRDRDYLKRANRRLRKLAAREAAIARTDALTGLANPRAFFEQLDVEIARAQRDKSPICIAYVDLDNFKKVNDSYGHLAGDELLKRTASALRQTIRKGDLAARLGGDEFGIMLWKVSPDEALQVAERILARIRELGHEYPRAHFGASIGIAYSKDTPVDFRAVISAADETMYAAKKLGKDRIELRQYPAVQPRPSVGAAV